MLKKHRNKIFEQIQADGFDIADFELNQLNESTDRVIVKDSSLWFQFNMQPESYDHFRFAFSRFTPNVNSSTHNNTVMFDKALLNLSSWLSSEVSQLISERDGEDLFDSFTKNSGFSFDNFDDDVHDKFSSSEVKFIRSKLDLLSMHIIETFEMTTEQNRRIESAIKYLQETVEERTKFDWRGILFSTILSIITTLTLDSEKGAKLWNFTVKLFEKINLLTK